MFRCYGYTDHQVQPTRNFLNGCGPAMKQSLDLQPSVCRHANSCTQASYVDELHVLHSLQSPNCDSNELG